MQTEPSTSAEPILSATPRRAVLRGAAAVAWAVPAVAIASPAPAQSTSTGNPFAPTGSSFTSSGGGNGNLITVTLSLVTATTLPPNTTITISAQTNQFTRRNWSTNTTGGQVATASGVSLSTSGRTNTTVSMRRVLTLVTSSASSSTTVSLRLPVTTFFSTQGPIDDLDDVTNLIITVSRPGQAAFSLTIGRP